MQLFADVDNFSTWLLFQEYCTKQGQVAHWQGHVTVITLATLSRLPLTLSTPIRSITGE